MKIFFVFDYTTAAGPRGIANAILNLESEPSDHIGIGDVRVRLSELLASNENPILNATIVILNWKVLREPNTVRHSEYKVAPTKFLGHGQSGAKEFPNLFGCKGWRAAQKGEYVYSAHLGTMIEQSGDDSFKQEVWELMDPDNIKGVVYD